jgi:cellulose synthase/poly-beta-1,6-N-acetylglucosamine synthase-like glycosyltransferase
LLTTESRHSNYGSSATDTQNKVKEASSADLACISLVIPTLNAEDCIEGLLLKLLSQTRVPDEILVVDSSSMDSTAEIIRRLSEANPCISLKVIERKNLALRHFWWVAHLCNDAAGSSER